MGRNPPRFPRLARNPNLIGGRAAKLDRSGIGRESQGLIVVSARDIYARTRANTPSFQKLQQVPITLVDPTDDIGRPGLGVSEKHQAAAAAADWAFEFTQIAMRARPAPAQLGQQPGFEVRRDGMFQTFGLIVNSIPFHPEDLRQHALDEVMAKGELARDLASSRGESNVPVALHSYQAVFLQAAQGHSDCRWGPRQPVG